MLNKRTIDAALKRKLKKLGLSHIQYDIKDRAGERWVLVTNWPEEGDERWSDLQIACHELGVILDGYNGALWLLS